MTTRYRIQRATQETEMAGSVAPKRVAAIAPSCDLASV